jgi:hypothetical protein
MALQPFDSESTEAAADKVLEGIRADSAKSRYNATAPREVRRESVEEQQAKREAVEGRQAEALANLEAEKAAIAAALESGDLQGTDAFETRFNDALAGAVAAQAQANYLAPPNPQTATRADWVRHEERVRANEQAKILEATKPAESDEISGADYWASLEAEDDDEPVVVVADDDTDGLYDEAEIEYETGSEYNWNFEPAE